MLFLFSYPSWIQILVSLLFAHMAIYHVAFFFSYILRCCGESFKFECSLSCARLAFLTANKFLFFLINPTATSMNWIWKNLVVYLCILNMLLECIFKFQKDHWISLREKYHLSHLALFHHDYVNQISSSNFLMKISQL